MKRPLRLRPKIARDLDITKPFTKDAFECLEHLNSNLVKQFIRDCDRQCEEW